MASIFTDLWMRVKIDYQEYRQELIANWSLRRENRQVEKARRRARIRNQGDGRTYYILKDRRGGISALNSDEIKFWTAKKMFPKMNYLQLLRTAKGIVTSNESIIKQYNQIQLKKESHE